MDADFKLDLLRRVRLAVLFHRRELRFIFRARDDVEAVLALVDYQEHDLDAVERLHLNVGQQVSIALDFCLKELADDAGVDPVFLVEDNLKELKKVLLIAVDHLVDCEYLPQLLQLISLELF